jgi:two-component system sensor kinase FixL
MSDSQSLAELLFERAPDAAIVIDDAGRIVRVNRQTEALFGYERAELLGQPVEGLLPVRFREAHALHVRGYLARPEIRRMGPGQQLFGLRRDGSEFPVELMLGPVAAQEGSFVLCTVRDATDRTRAEERAQLLEAELAYMGRVQIMGEMASGLAHELSQPLAAVINYTQGCVRRLQNEGGAADILEAMTRASAQAERAGKIIHQLRSMIRRGQPTLVPVDLNSLVNEVLALAQPEVRRGEVVLQLELAGEPLPVRADPIQIEQVILNLVRNSLEAMASVDRTRRTLTLRTARTEQDSHRLAILDTGGGLSEETKARLFTPFFSTKKQGMGLGLAISKSIIEAHRGQLWASTNPDGGAIFQFSLPRHQTDAANETNTDSLRR